MPDPTTIEAVANHASSIGATLTYYAPGLFAVAAPFIVRYVKPTVDAMLELPALLKEQNALLRQANEQRSRQTNEIAKQTTVIENK